MGANSSTSKATIINGIANQIRLDNVSRNESVTGSLITNIQSLTIQIGARASFDCPGLTIDQNIKTNSKLIAQMQTQTNANLSASITTALNNLAKAYSESGMWGVGSKSYSSTDLANYIANSTDISMLNENLQRVNATSNNSQNVTIVLDKGATLIIRVSGCNFYQHDISQLQTAQIMSAIYDTTINATDLTQIKNDAESTSTSGSSPCGSCGSGEIGGIAGGVVGVLLVLVVGGIVLKLVMNNNSSKTQKPVTYSSSKSQSPFHLTSSIPSNPSPSSMTVSNPTSSSRYFVGKPSSTSARPVRPVRPVRLPRR